MPACQLRIHGRVQGVAYRAWAAGAAGRLGLAGWVRNEPDGSVSAMVEGPRSRLDAFVELCRAGPEAARVTRVEVSEATPEGATAFRILR